MYRVYAEEVREHIEWIRDLNRIPLEEMEIFEGGKKI